MWENIAGAKRCSRPRGFNIAGASPGERPRRSDASARRCHRLRDDFSSFQWVQVPSLRLAPFPFSPSSPFFMPSRPGLYLSNFIRGSKFWLLKSTTVLMHRYIESRPLRFFNSSRRGGVRNFRRGVQPQPPDIYSPAPDLFLQ